MIKHTFIIDLPGGQMPPGNYAAKMAQQIVSNLKKRIRDEAGQDLIEDAVIDPGQGQENFTQDKIL